MPLGVTLVTPSVMVMAIRCRFAEGPVGKARDAGHGDVVRCRVDRAALVAEVGRICRFVLQHMQVGFGYGAGNIDRIEIIERDIRGDAGCGQRPVARDDLAGRLYAGGRGLNFSYLDVSREGAGRDIEHDRRITLRGTVFERHARCCRHGFFVVAVDVAVGAGDRAGAADDQRVGAGDDTAIGQRGRARGGEVAARNRERMRRIVVVVSEVGQAARRVDLGAGRARAVGAQVADVLTTGAQVEGRRCIVGACRGRRRGVADLDNARGCAAVADRELVGIDQIAGEQIDPVGNERIGRGESNRTGRLYAHRRDRRGRDAAATVALWQSGARVEPDQVAGSAVGCQRAVVGQRAASHQKQHIASAEGCAGIDRDIQRDVVEVDERRRHHCRMTRRGIGDDDVGQHTTQVEGLGRTGSGIAELQRAAGHAGNAAAGPGCDSRPR